MLLARQFAIPAADLRAVWTEEVLAEADALVGRHARTADQRRLLELALVGLKAQSREMDSPAYIHLPLLVYAGLAGDHRPAVSLAAAASLVFLGMDIMDDLADGDQPAHWVGHSPGEINLAAATLLCALPQLALAEQDAPPDRLAAMHETLARGLMRISAGQERDLAMVDSADAKTADVEAVLHAKGEEMSIFAELAAHLGKASPESVQAYASLGRSIGIAGQLASDCYDLFTDADSRDLMHGTRTLPVVLHLERQTVEERVLFLVLLERGREDEGVRSVVRERLRTSGALRHCAFAVEVHCQRARRTLEQLNPLEPGLIGLRAMIDGILFFPKGASP